MYPGTQQVLTKYLLNELNEADYLWHVSHSNKLLANKWTIRGNS